MIQEFREYSQSFGFKLILGIVAVSLVISLGVGSFFGERKEVIALVNDREILMKDFRRAYSNQLESMRRELGENAERFAEQMNLRGQVLQQLVDQELLLDEADDLEIEVTDLELQDYIRQQPYFQKNGQFDSEVYREVLKQNRIPLFEYEDGLRRDLLVQKKQRLMAIGLMISNEEVNEAYRQQFEQVKVNYVHFAPEHFLDQVSPTEEELATYHQAHPEEFQSPRQYQIEFFTLSLNAFTDAEKVREREVRRFYERNLDAYTTPPEAKARHILFKLDPEASETLRNERREALNGVRQRILDGQDFAEVAKELSEDLSAEQGGDLGWFKPGEMVAAFEETAFQLKPGEVSEVVESPFGLHLILVEDRKEAIERSLEEVREEVIATLAEQRAESDLDEALTRIEGVIARQALSELASEYGGELRQSELFSRESVIPGIGSAFGLIGQLDGKQAGDSGVWKRNPVQGHVVWKISAVAEPAPLPLEQTKDRVLETVRQQQALEYALQQARQALGQVQGGASLEETAKALELEIQPMEFAIGTRFLPELGDNSEFRKQALQLSSESPWALSENGRRVDLMHFEKRWLDEADLDARQAQIRNSLLRLQQQTLLEKEIKRLRETASIEVISPLLQLPGA